jgi:hypothetical protein
MAKKTTIQILGGIAEHNKTGEQEPFIEVTINGNEAMMSMHDAEQMALNLIQAIKAVKEEWDG